MRTGVPDGGADGVAAGEEKLDDPGRDAPRRAGHAHHLPRPSHPLRGAHDRGPQVVTPAPAPPLPLPVEWRLRTSEGGAVSCCERRDAAGAGFIILNRGRTGEGWDPCC